MKIDVFTGGIFDTNTFFLPDSGILIDAPQGAADWLAESGHRVQWLLLTHGHIDHVWDAARIKAEHGCRVGCHRDTVPSIVDRSFYKQFGMNWEIEPVTPDHMIEESESDRLAGVEFQVLLVPGHCPGSLCFLEKEHQILFGGDVLFAGGIGRTDLPGGDHALLLRGIREKLWLLDDNVTVLPGHGPATKIGIEKRTNPFLSGM